MAQPNWQRPPFAGGPPSPWPPHGPPYHPLPPPPHMPPSQLPCAPPPAHQYPPRGFLPPPPPRPSLLQTSYSNAQPLISPPAPHLYMPPPRTPPSWQGPVPPRPPPLQAPNALAGPSSSPATFPAPVSGIAAPFMAPANNPQIGSAGSRDMSSTNPAASQNVPLGPHFRPGFLSFPFPTLGFLPRLPLSSPTLLQSQSVAGGGTSLGQAGGIAGTTEVEEDPSEADSWSAHKGDDGVVYYFNATTGVSTFQKPPNLNLEAQSGPPTPVSWERVAGTEWAVVTTDDGKKYFYNGKSQSTSWAVPLEVATARKLAQQSAATAARTAVTAPPAAGQLDAIKKKLQDAAFTPPPLAPDSTLGLLPVGPPPGLEGEEEGGSGSVSSDASSEEEGKKTLSSSEKAAHYKEMLIEKGIAPFAKWDKELPKILFDHRFKAISNPNERRSLFDSYVRTRAEEERREKRAAQKAAVSGFNALLDEAHETFSHATGRSDMEAVWGEDERWSATEVSDRDRLLKERLAPLVAAESARMAEIRHVAREGFIAMLKEQKEWSGSTRWSKVSSSLRSDLRYGVVSRDERESLFDSHVGKMREEEEEREERGRRRRRQLQKEEEEAKVAARAKAAAEKKEEEEEEQSKKRDFRRMLGETIASDVRNWSDAKRMVRQDPRYARVPRADREEVWGEYLEGRDEGGEKKRGKENMSKGGKEVEEEEEMEEGEERVERHVDGDRGRDRDRDRSRDRDEGRDRGRDRDRERGRDRGRDKDDEVDREREREKEKRREKGRDRERDGGGRGSRGREKRAHEEIEEEERGRGGTRKGKERVSEG